jgi:predicted type IV restriction endonuclease
VKDAIIEIREGIRTGKFYNEASVSQGIVQRILQLLGWPIYNPEIVSPEYSLDGRRVDYALCCPVRKPIVFIEVKQIGQSDGADKQLFEYAFHLGVPLAILTDGQEWHFFLPAEQGTYGERRVYKLDISERAVEECLSRLERYLSYDAICSGKAIESARMDYRNVAKERQIRSVLPEAWRKLIEEKDDFLIETFSDKVESLCGYKPDQSIVMSFLNSLYLVDNSGQNNSPKPKEKDRQNKNAIDKSDGSRKIHIYTIHGAKAKMVMDGSSYIVLRGSTAKKEDKKSMPQNAKKLKDNLIKSGRLVLKSSDNLYEFAEDISFKSPSLASCIVSGTSTNGKLCFSIIA